MAISSLSSRRPRIPSIAWEKHFFSLSAKNVSDGDAVTSLESILNIRYGIYGDRTLGAHLPVAIEASVTEYDKQNLLFKSALVLQRPVLHPFLPVGFVPLSSKGLRVGQLITMKWRIERVITLQENEDSTCNLDDVLCEIDAKSENWMIAGRKRGHVSLSAKQGSRMVISILCMPLVAGYVCPPKLGLPNIDKANISCNLVAPHLVCVLPPALSSSFCIPA